MTRLYTAQEVRDNLSANTKTIRNRLGYSQNLFAAHIRIKRCTLGSYEEGRCDAPLKVCLAICKIGGCTIDSFLTEKLK